MFFKDHFISIADILDAKFSSYNKIAKNPADKGELCELFIKEFLVDALEDSFKVFRGGRVINSSGLESKQLDIILAGKKTIKIFGDKGIYPTESVFGCCSVTATLTRQKLKDCCEEFLSIPKTGYHFESYGFLSEKFVTDSINAWRTLIPYKVVFAFKGELKAEWIQDIIEFSKNAEVPYNTMPDLVVVNKVGMIEKSIKEDLSAEFKFLPFTDYKNYGMPFSKMLYHMNNFNWEELFITPQLSEYLNKDL